LSAGRASEGPGRPFHAPEARLFVAVPLPEAARDTIAGAVDRVRRRLEAADRAAFEAGGEPGGRVRWVRLDGLHVTLRFLGGAAEERLEELRDVVDVAAAAATPFEVALDGAGAFPVPGRPRTLWLGIVEGGEGLAGLAAGVEDALVAFGWPREERPFRPHLTVARTDGVHAGPLAARELAAAARGLAVRFTADRLVLYRSHLGGGPARYEPLHEAAIDGSRARPLAGRIARDAAPG